MHLDTLNQLSRDLAQIAQADGLNAKRELARKWCSKEHRELLDMIGNGDRVFYVTWASVQVSEASHGVEWDDLWFEAASRASTPAKTAARIKGLLESGYPENVLKAIVEKTPDCGLTVKEFLKSIGDRKSFAVALAKSWTDMPRKKQEKLLVESDYCTTPKMDGLRSFWVLIPGQERAVSRHMKPLYNQDHILKALLEHFKGTPGVVDGEILSSTNNWEDSMTATKTQDGSKVAAYLYPFDFIPADEFLSGLYTMQKRDRLAFLQGLDYTGNLFRRVPFTPVKSVAQVNFWLRTHLSAGWEGSVLHDMGSVYRPNTAAAENRTTALVKVKEWKSADLTVIGTIPGTGKHLGRLGSLLVEGSTEDGRMVKSEVGTGFSDQERESFWNSRESLTGRCVEVKYFQVTASNQRGVGSLRFPSYLRLRPDKDQA